VTATDAVSPPPKNLEANMKMAAPKKAIKKYFGRLDVQFVCVLLAMISPMMMSG